MVKVEMRGLEARRWYRFGSRTRWECDGVLVPASVGFGISGHGHGQRGTIEITLAPPLRGEEAAAQTFNQESGMKPRSSPSPVHQL